jgi:hypothetical protein
MEAIATKVLLNYFFCPSCRSSDLAEADDIVTCRTCQCRYPIKRGVIDFLLYDKMGETEKKELKAMTLPIDDEQKVCWIIEKEKWDRIQTHFLMRGIQAAERYLSKYAYPGITLVTMGSGAGFELRALSQFIAFDKIIASDISWTASYAISKSIEQRVGMLGLFAADFKRCPVKRSSEVVGFVFEALHHTDNVHKTIETMLAHNFDHLVFVEPTRNWLVNMLSKVGLTLNIEYSGLKPDWINLRTVRKIARYHHYRMEVSTWWPFPDSLVPKAVKKVKVLSMLLCSIVDGVSWLTNLFHFGAMSAVHLYTDRRPTCSNATPVALRLHRRG